MNPELPVIDDKLVWDAWMSMYKVPSITVALELEIFETLHETPASAEGLASHMNFSERGLLALLPMLMSMGFLCQREGKYQLSEAGVQYMLKSSPFFWGGLFKRVGRTIYGHKLLLETVANTRENSQEARAVDGWEEGHLDREAAKEITEFMHSHSLPSAVGMTQTYDLSGIKKLLDVGGGSGCFAIAMARSLPDLQCTVMDLETICELADDYIADAGVSSQVNTKVVDMFREDWPLDYDAHFYSNIFHDWGFETCAELAALSFNALPSGGRILLHEMLLDDGGTAPHNAVVFSVLMALGTLGQQFTFLQLKEILTKAGFTEVNCQHTYGYYSVVSAVKP